MDFEYEIIDGEVTITGYKNEFIESITIPEYIDGYLVRRIGYNAFENCIHLNDVRIPNSVISIMIEAFWNCVSLTKIKIPDSVINIDENAFGRCISLKEINIPNSVIDIGKYTFWDCDSLTEINNVKLNNDINTINKRFIYHKQSIYKIQYQIGEDYYCENNIIFINDKTLNLN